jgi:hypothetical protein
MIDYVIDGFIVMMAAIQSFTENVNNRYIIFTAGIICITCIISSYNYYYY